MAVRVNHNVLVQISRDTAGKDKAFYPETKLVTVDGWDKQMTSELAIAGGANENLSFGDIAAVKGIYLEVDRDANVILNSGAEVIALKLPPGATQGGSGANDKATLFLNADITAVNVENTDATNALNGVYAAWGDPTP